MNKRRKFIQSAYAVVPTGVDLSLFGFKENCVEIRQLVVDEPGQGTGSQLMRTLVHLADECDIELSLDAHPFDYENSPDFGVHVQMLMDWYARFGFVADDPIPGCHLPSTRMRRKPKLLVTGE